MPPTTFATLYEAMPAFRLRSRYMELAGGLGDILNHLHWLSCYRGLDDLKPGERAFVMCSSHNAAVKELFDWHPKAAQLDLCAPGFLCGLFDPHWRIANGLPPAGCSDHRGPLVGPVTYYPSPDDLSQLELIAKGTPYVVFALTAGTPERTIPVDMAQSAAAAAIKLGLRVVQVGRSYSRREGPHVDRVELKLHPNPSVVDMIDKLSVPGTARLVEGAAGVFSCHSSICLLSWSVGRPTFLVYGDHARDVLVPLGPYGYLNGIQRSDGDAMHFAGYTPERMSRWLTKLK